MKRSYIVLASFLALIGTSFAQNERSAFDASFDPIRLELEEWDPIRGPWLASSLEAMSHNEEIPDRTFPEDLTPAQMVSALPEKTRSGIERIAIANNPTNTTEQAQWNEIRRVVVRPGAGCERRNARTYGDPHMVTYDGARYSFQTVGEFVLSESTSGLEIQARQKPQREDFSLNTAVAMNVGGDRVGIYADDFPDGNRANVVRVNGMPITMPSGRAYFLNNGGTIRQSGSTYTVSWPTGETVVAQIQNSGGMPFMNVNVQITECSQGLFTGLLGNANGIEGDDFRGLNDQPDLRLASGNDPFGGISQEMEQRRLAFLANTLADEFRVTDLTTLFEYPIGRNTASFTDRSFPRVHRTLNEIPQDRRDAARRQCEQNGISARDMNGCIFDNSHLNLPPDPRPIITDPSEGIVLAPVTQPRPNVNEGRLVPKPTEVDPSKEVEKAPRLTPMPMPQGEPQPRKERLFNRDRDIDERPVAEPTRSEPVRSEPVRTEPVRSEPVRTEPVRSEPVRSEPVRSQPVRSEPVRTEPVRRSEPVRSTPTPSAPTRSTPSTPTRSSGGRG